MTIKHTFASASLIAASVLLVRSAAADVTIDGSLDAAYGSALAAQTVNTGFGNSSGGDSLGGSELDAAYGVIQGGNLNLFLSGNFENNGNHLNIFIDGGAAGQSVLNVPTTATLQAMNGSKFSPGFQATYAYDMNDFAGTLFNEEYTYAGAGALAGGYVGSVPETSTGIAAGKPSGGGFAASATIALNNTHVSTMGTAGTAANQAAADAVTTGFEISVPLSQIGYTGGPIEVLADINGGGDNFLSNQTLPGQPVGTGNLGTPGFDFSSTPGEFFTVSAPTSASAPDASSTLALLGGISAVLFFMRRKLVCV